MILIMFSYLYQGVVFTSGPVIHPPFLGSPIARCRRCRRHRHQLLRLGEAGRGFFGGGRAALGGERASPRVGASSLLAGLLGKRYIVNNDNYCILYIDLTFLTSFNVIPIIILPILCSVMLNLCQLYALSC